MDYKEYWEYRYVNGGNSGAGSYGDELTWKMERLSKLVGVFSITEVGCGDFNFGNRVVAMFPEATYTGLDVSKFIIEKNKDLYSRHTFLPMGDVPPADLLLCVDVLFHITDDKEYEEMLNKLEKAWTKYLCITAYEYDDDTTAPHVKIRKFDYKRFGEPIVREVCEEDGQKYFYIFQK